MGVVKAGTIRMHAPLAVGGGDPREAAHRAALQDAYRAGVMDGQAAAEAEAAGAGPAIAAALDRAAADASAAAADQVRADGHALLDAAVELARWFIGREITQDPTALLARLDEAVDHLAPADALTVTVAPVLVDAMREWGAAATAAVEVVPDVSMAVGDARVTTGRGVAGLDVAAALLDARAAIGSLDAEVPSTP